MADEEAPSYPDPHERYAKVLDRMERHVRKLRQAIEGRERVCATVSLELGQHQTDPDLPGLYRKLQQAEKELAELVSKQVIPPGVGDAGAEEQGPTTDKATEAAKGVLSEVIRRARPDVVTRDPELTPEEIEEGYEDALGEAPKT